jgi:hypothetical protein
LYFPTNLFPNKKILSHANKVIPQGRIEEKKELIERKRVENG